MPYDLRQHYMDNVGRAMGVVQDWEVMGSLNNSPADYHFTRHGMPDKRYTNYPEAAAYYNAELELRSEMIANSQRPPEESNSDE